MAKAISKSDRSEGIEPVDLTPEEAAPAPLTANAGPALTIYGDRLEWHAGSKHVALPLESLLTGEANHTVGLLLYAIVLKINDVDASFRHALQLSESQIASAGSPDGPAGQLVEQVFAQFKALGLDLSPGDPSKNGESVPARGGAEA